ncbi:MAG: SAM-dependent chlorinase/fluorinase [Bacteroidia bacterium]|nr:SAM-dependent chlorinase/fluorinase [Bacteroidia bacterium]
MSIITLTTDLGIRDSYAASLKGVLLSRCPTATLIDVTHEVPKYNLMEAAFILKQIYTHFPDNSIHLIGVDPEQHSRSRGVVMYFRSHYFVAPDNGVLSLIRERENAEFVEIMHPDILDQPLLRTFRSLSVLAPAAGMLAAGISYKALGNPATDLRENIWGHPTYSENSLRGTIIHIDHFGNAITNITKEEFLQIKGQRSFQIFIRNARLQRIVSTYGDVTRGEALAIIGLGGHLELAIREGSAEQLLGLSTGDMLTIEFYG